MGCAGQIEKSIGIVFRTAVYFFGAPKMKNVVAIVVISLMCLLLPNPATSQAISGDLVGVVKDSTGAVVPNATVQATNVATGVQLHTQTNADGEYRLINLPVGRYDLQVTSNGLSGGIKSVPVELNKRATANITLQVAQATTTVEVTAQAATIDTTTPQIQTTFETKEAQDIPTASVGLGVLNLSLLNAGVASSGGIGAGTGPAVSGQRPRNNNFTIEGVDNNNKSVTGPLVTVPNDAVANFTVLQNQFSPEYGHSSGGQFNTVIQSGTNHVHGRVYEYFQNRNLNADDAFVVRGTNGHNPRYDNNRFGGQIGGPIVKDKLFFFGNAEYNPIGQATTSTACSPTAAGFSTLGSIGGLSANNLAILQKYLPAATSSDPSCPNSVTVGGTTVATGFLPISGSQYNNTFTTADSVDLNLSQTDQLRFRYIYSKNDGLDVAAQLPAFWIPSPSRYHVFTFAEYHNFGPNVSNEFRLGYNRYSNFTEVPSITAPGLSVFPNLTIDEFNGVNIGPDPNGPQFTIQNTYQAVENLTWIKGKHNVKLGVEGRKYISPSHFIQRERGDYYWLTLDDFLHDVSPTDFGERSTGHFNYPGDQSAIYAYGADTIRITPGLSVDLGLRYEFTSVPFGERLQSFNSAASVPGLITFAEPQPQYKNFAPRVGFAFAPFGTQNTSIRGGFAMSYDVLYDNLGTLSLGPQFSGTCDVGTNAAPCTYSDTAFLASGGLPGTAPGAGLQTFPTIADQRAATAAYIPNQRLPYSETWDFGIQQLIGKDYNLEIRYVGTRGLHLPVQTRLNRQNKVTATQFLPTYLSNPGPTALNALTTTLTAINANSSFVPAYTAAGFTSNITAFEPYGKSVYNGLQTQLRKSLSHGLQYQVAWTWSHAQDNSTADVFSTLLTPRRPQDFQNFAADYSTSALDRRHRVTAEIIYDEPYFKNSNFFAKNILGNWEIVPVYTFETPEYATVQSAVDSNLNGDSFGDRAIFNPNGVPGTGSSVTPLKNSSGATVAYLALNPNAQYIVAGPGALANSTRNSLPLRRRNNWDLTAVKRINFTETTAMEFQAQALNVFNHSQYLPGSVNQVNSIGYTSGAVRSFLTPGVVTSSPSSTNSFNPEFDDPTLVFSNNPRTMQLALKFIF